MKPSIENIIRLHQAAGGFGKWDRDKAEERELQSLFRFVLALSETLSTAVFKKILSSS